MTHHHATIQVLSAGANQSRIVWNADVWPNEAADRVGPMMEQGALVMKKEMDSLKSEVRSLKYEARA